MSNKTQKKGIKVAATLIAIVLIGVICVYAAVLINPVVVFYSDLAEQKERIAYLKENPGKPVDEQSFADFDLSRADEIKFNQIQTLITHNSYKKNISDLNYIALRPFTGVEGSRYEHDFLTNQLNNGVRGFELDIQYIGGEFLIYHIAIKDSATHCPSWELALEELKIWSDNNPNHLPISMLIEIKTQNLNTKVLQKLDNSIAEIMGKDKLITPSLLMGENGTLSNVAANNDWITLDKVMGKFMFILHPADCTERYINIDTSMQTQNMVPMFTSLQYEEASPKYADYFLLLKHDKLEIEKIQVYINSGFMVRTRMDEPCIYKEGNQQLAVMTGAQIISADYEPGVILPVVDYMSILTDGKTVVLQRNLFIENENLPL